MAPPTSLGRGRPAPARSTRAERERRQNQHGDREPQPQSVLVRHSDLLDLSWSGGQALRSGSVLVVVTVRPGRFRRVLRGVFEPGEYAVIYFLT